MGRQRTKTFIKKIKPYLKKVSESLLLYIIFCAISESFYTGLDAGYVDIIVMFVVIFIIHTMTLALVWYLSGFRGPPPSEYNTNWNEANVDLVPQQSVGDVDDNNVNTKPKKRSINRIQKCCDKETCLRFTLYDRIAILFCACQKTAAFGIPIVSSLFESSEYLGVYLVPLLIYHPLQLIIDSFLVQPLSLKVSRYEKARAIAAGHREDEENDNDGNGTDTL